MLNRSLVQRVTTAQLTEPTFTSSVEMVHIAVRVKLFPLPAQQVNSELVLPTIGTRSPVASPAVQVLTVTWKRTTVCLVRLVSSVTRVPPHPDQTAQPRTVRFVMQVSIVSREP